MCTSPFYLKEYLFEVPCGQCLQCRINKRKEWSLRLLHHMSYNNDCIFLTLTYNDENLINPSLNKRDFQLFMKRFRKCHKQSIKYFACGEYGDKTYRKHFHAIIFGVSLRSILSDSRATYKFRRKGFDYFSLSLPYWSNGFAIVTTVSPDTIGYVAGYVTKKLKGYKKKYEELGLLPPFQLQSQGLGKEYAFDNEERLKSELFCYFKDKKVSIPRYYRKLLDIDSSYFSTIIADKKLKLIQMLDDKNRFRIGEKELFRYFDISPKFIDECREQKDLTLKAKEKLYSRDIL